MRITRPVDYPTRTVTIRPPYEKGGSITAQVEILRRRNGKPVSNHEYQVTERQLSALIGALEIVGRLPRVDESALKYGEFIIVYDA